jgi:hypothetical protein
VYRGEEFFSSLLAWLLFVLLCHYRSRERNKGVAIELAHFLGDGLFMADEL